MVCGPKAAQRRAPGRVGLGRVLPKHAEEKALTGGSRASATEGGRERGLSDWAGPAWIGPRRGFGPQGGKEKRKREKGRKRWAYWAENKKMKRNGFAFCTTSNKTMHCSMNATQKKQPYLI